MLQLIHSSRSYAYGSYRLTSTINMIPFRSNTTSTSKDVYMYILKIRQRLRFTFAAQLIFPSSSKSIRSTPLYHSNEWVCRSALAYWRSVMLFFWMLSLPSFPVMLYSINGFLHATGQLRQALTPIYESVANYVCARSLVPVANSTQSTYRYHNPVWWSLSRVLHRIKSSPTDTSKVHPRRPGSLPWSWLHSVEQRLDRFNCISTISYLD